MGNGFEEFFPIRASIELRQSERGAWRGPKETDDDDGYQAYHREREFALSGLLERGIESNVIHSIKLCCCCSQHDLHDLSPTS